MRIRTCVLSSIFILVTAVIFISASCDNSVTPSIVGTWVNSDYDGGVGDNTGKAVIAHVDGDNYTWAGYINHDDTVPEYIVPFTVTNESTDSEGNLIIQSLSYPGDPPIMYSLSKIHADNQTMEGNVSDVDYPSEINPAGGDYFIMYRR
jgi:hypothetical protein